MLERENDELSDGTGMQLVKAPLNLNKHREKSDSEKRDQRKYLIQAHTSSDPVIIMSKLRLPHT